MYSTTKQALEVSGINTTIIQESLGTGDNSNLDFSLDHTQIIADTYSLYFASSTTSNSFTNLTETTDYILDKPKGKIRLTTTGANNLGTNILFSSYDWCEPFTDAQVSRAIVFSDSEIDELTGKRWSSAISFTEEFDFIAQKTRSNYKIYTRTEEESSDAFSEDYVIVNFLPLVSITAIQFFDVDGNEETSEAFKASDHPKEFEFYSFGKIVFKKKTLSTAYKKVKITGTYGRDSTPAFIQELSSLMTAIRLYINLSGGSYNDVTSYSLGGVSVGVGEPYINIREFLTQAEKRIKRLLNLAGRKHFIVAVG